MGLQKRLSYYVTSIVAIIFLVTMGVVCYATMHRSFKTASHEAELEVENAAGIINARFDAVQAAIDNAALAVQRNMRFNNADSLQGIVESVVTENPGIIGSAIAFRPGLFPQEEGHLMMYAYKDLWKNVISKRLGDDINYNYTQMEWFANPMKSGVSGWSEPYFDKGAGETMMCTYSHPIKADGREVGVITGDVTLLDIKEIIEETGIDDTPGRVIISSRNRSELYSDGDILGADSIKCLRFTADLPSTGWMIEKAIPYRQLMAPTWHVMKLMFALCMFTLVVLFLAINYAIHRLSQPEVDRQARLDTELTIASNIQNGMLPRQTRTDNVAALLRPAKEVSGDFFNYITVGDNLHFIIADVSGKGIPAAIHMAIAIELYALTANDDLSPAEIATKINSVLAKDNPSSMFTTALIGRLSLTSGRLELCNSGHNPPLMTNAEGTECLNIENNIPLGVLEEYKFEQSVMVMQAGSRLLAYTDGVTEAESSKGEQFGHERLVQIARMDKSRGVIEQILNAVDEFSAGRGQTDDITMMAVTYDPPEQLRLDPDIAQISKIRSLGLEDNLNLALEEAVVNAVSYSGCTFIDIAVSRNDQEVTVTLAYDGVEFDPTLYEPQVFDPDMPTIGGQGIRLMKSLTDKVEYNRTDTRNLITFTKWKHNIK